MRDSWRWLAILGLIVLGAFLFYRWLTPRSPDSNAAAPVPDSPSRPALTSFPVSGALVSADNAHPRYFDRAASASFEQSVEAKLRPYIVHLNSRAFLPLHAPDEASLRKVVGQSKTPKSSTWNISYIQFLSQPSDSDRQALKDSGIELLNYVTDYAWAAKGAPDDFVKAAAHPNIRAISAIDAVDKLHPAVYFRSIPNYARTPQGDIAFSLLAYPGTSADVLAAELAALPVFAGQEPNLKALTPSVLGPRFRLEIGASSIIAVAAARQIAFIEYIQPPMADRDATTDSTSNITPVRDQGPHLDGTGITVGVREIGKPDAHVDFAARLQYIDANGDSPNKDHATNVVGQIASNGVSKPAAKGVAPNVHVLVYSLMDSSFGTHDIVDSGARGARVSNHSYGPAGLTVFGDYETDSATWDDALRGNNLLAFFAGNEESDAGKYKHIDFFVGMKNGLCIEASSAAATAGNPTAFPPVPPTDGTASFAKYGPMNDGRVKPDLVAFGDSVTLDQGINNTVTNSGTSFSTPAATGVAALVLQQYKAALGTEPSAAMTKTLLIESASDLGPPGPDAVYGFGIVNAQEAVRLISLRTAADTSPFSEGTLANGQAQTYSINVPPNSPLLKVTVCWLDPAGNPAAAKALVNDLDMILVDPSGVTHFPYSLDPANPSAPATASGPNRVDPVEQISVPNPGPGVWTATISGFSIPNGTQPYAFCANYPGGNPLSAVIQASPISGPAPLTVSFTAAQSTGNIVSYLWDFGDGSQGSNVTETHTFTLPPPPAVPPFAFTVKLIVADGQGNSKSTTQQITITKPVLQAFPQKVSGKVDFTKPASDRLQFTLISHDLVYTPEQARNAVRDGVFEGKKYLVSIGRTDQTVVTPLATFLVDRHAAQRGKTENFALNLTQGTLTVSFQQTAGHDLDALYRLLGITRSMTTTTTIDMHVQVETDNAIYDAVFPKSILYKPSRSGGALMYKN